LEVTVGAQEMRRCVDKSKLTRRELKELLYDMKMVREDGLTPRPKLTVITLKKPLRLATSAHSKVTKKKALGWLMHALTTDSKYDGCFDVKVYSIAFPEES
jgi:hypothetical protein